MNKEWMKKYIVKPTHVKQRAKQTNKKKLHSSRANCMSIAPYFSGKNGFFSQTDLQ